MKKQMVEEMLGSVRQAGAILRVKTLQNREHKGRTSRNVNICYLCRPRSPESRPARYH